jgi:hypothetical protein
MPDTSIHSLPWSSFQTVEGQQPNYQTARFEQAFKKFLINRFHEPNRAIEPPHKWVLLANGDQYEQNRFKEGLEILQRRFLRNDQHQPYQPMGELIHSLYCRLPNSHHPDFLFRANTFGQQSIFKLQTAYRNNLPKTSKINDLELDAHIAAIQNYLTHNGDDAKALSYPCACSEHHLHYLESQVALFKHHADGEEFDKTMIKYNFPSLHNENITPLQAGVCHQLLKSLASFSLDIRAALKNTATELVGYVQNKLNYAGNSATGAMVLAHIAQTEPNVNLFHSPFMPLENLISTLIHMNSGA